MQSIITIYLVVNVVSLKITYIKFLQQQFNWSRSFRKSNVKSLYEIYQSTKQFPVYRHAHTGTKKLSSRFSSNGRY